MLQYYSSRIPINNIYKDSVHLRPTPITLPWPFAASLSLSMAVGNGTVCTPYLNDLTCWKDFQLSRGNNLTKTLFFKHDINREPRCQYFRERYCVRVTISIIWYCILSICLFNNWNLVWRYTVENVMWHDKLISAQIINLSKCQSAVLRVSVTYQSLIITNLLQV